MIPVVMTMVQVAEILEIFQLLQTKWGKHFGKDV